MLFFLLLSTLKTSSWHQKPQTLDTVIMCYVYTNVVFSQPVAILSYHCFPSLKITKKPFMIGEASSGRRTSGKVEIIVCIYIISYALSIFNVHWRRSTRVYTQYNLLYLPQDAVAAKYICRAILYSYYACIKISL